MPLKKKETKKKKKKSTIGGADDAEDDEGTVISVANGDGTEELLGQQDGKRGKKKKRRKKKNLTKSEKSTAKLDKAADKLKADKAFYNQFVNRLDAWLCKISRQAVQIFKKFDADGEGLVTYDEFKCGMLDLNCPCRKIEMHLLCKLLDLDNTGDVDYTEIPKGLQYVREVDELNRQNDAADQQLILGERNIDHCKCCKLGISEPYRVKNPRYILAKFRLVTFEGFKDHPGHFEEVVHSHIPVFGLIQLIVEQTGIQSTKLSIFIDRTRRKEAMLPIEMTLDELGYQGYSYDDPEEVKLYYDYKIEFTECPILLCDHYFGQKSKLPR